MPSFSCTQIHAERGLCYANESREHEGLAVSGVHVCCVWMHLSTRAYRRHTFADILIFEFIRQPHH